MLSSQDSKKVDADVLHHKLSSMGDFYELKTNFDEMRFNEELESNQHEWIRYNKSKSWSHRYGLSLFSLDGGTSGEIDLNSTKEIGDAGATYYDEMAFRVPTPIWNHFESVSQKLSSLVPYLGRSHFLRLDEGGIFPPHRDNIFEPSFRLIGFFNCSPSELHLVVDGRNCHFTTNRLYFLNTRKVHSVVSFHPGAILLVLNVSLEKNAVDFVLKNIRQH